MAQAPAGGFPRPQFTDPPTITPTSWMRTLTPTLRAHTTAQVTLTGKGQSRGGHQITDPKRRAPPLWSLRWAKTQEDPGQRWSQSLGGRH